MEFDYAIVLERRARLDCTRWRKLSLSAWFLLDVLGAGEQAKRKLERHGSASKCRRKRVNFVNADLKNL